MTATGEYTRAFPEAGPAPRWLVIATTVVAVGLVTLAATSVVTSTPAIESSRPAVLPGAAITAFGPITSHNGRFRSQVIQASPVVSDVPSPWIVQVATRDGRRVANAQLDVRASMPEGNSIAPLPLTSRYIGSGKYEIDDVRLTRPGWWNVALVIRYRGVTDSLAFNVILPDGK